jgi:hypothetical protein
VGEKGSLRPTMGGPAFAVDESSLRWPGVSHAARIEGDSATNGSTPAAPDFPAPPVDKTTLIEGAARKTSSTHQALKREHEGKAKPRRHGEHRDAQRRKHREAGRNDERREHQR